MFIHVILNNNGKPLKPCSGSAISCLINLMNTFIQFASWKYIINGTDMIVPTWVTDIKRELLHCSIYRRCHCWNMTVIFTTIKHNSLHVYDCYGVRFYFTKGVRFILRQVYDLFYVIFNGGLVPFQSPFMLLCITYITDNVVNLYLLLVKMAACLPIKSFTWLWLFSMQLQ